MAKSNVSAVVNNFPTVNEGFTTTLGSTIASAATTVPLSSASGLTNGTIFVGIIEPGGTKEQVFTGIVDTGGSQITGVKWTRGTNDIHTSGVAIVDYTTGTAINMMVKGILVSHNQDGTIKDGAVSTTAMLVDSIVTAAKLAANAVTTTKLIDDAVTAAKMVNGVVYWRQGGSGTVWDNPGTSNVNTSSITPFIQCGAIQSSSSSDVTVVFPVPYTGIPLIYATIATAGGFNCFVITSGHSTTGFDFRLLDTTNTKRAEYINWMAIGV